MPTPIPNEAYPFASAHDWLKNAIEAGDFDLFALVETLMEKGLLDNDTIRDIYQDEMDEQGFFTPTREWMLKQADKQGVVWCYGCDDIVKNEDEHPEAEEGGHPTISIRDYLEAEFRLIDGQKEMHEFGKERGWWR